VKNTSYEEQHQENGRGRLRSPWLDSGTAWIGLFLDLVLRVTGDKSQGIIKMLFKRDDFYVVLFSIH